MSNNYQHEQDNSKPLFTEDIFYYLEKYFDDKPINQMVFSEYEKLKFSLEMKLSYLAKQIEKQLSQEINKRILKTEFYETSFSKASSLEMTHVWYTLWFCNTIPIYFSSELDEQSLSLHIYIEYDKERNFTLYNLRSIYDLTMSFMFYETVIDMVKYRQTFNIENDEVNFFYTKNSDQKEIEKTFKYKTYDFNNTEFYHHNDNNLIKQPIFILEAWTFISQDELLSLSSQEIINKITKFIESFFPLILLFTSHDPQKEIYQYLHIPTYPIEDLIEDTNLEEKELNQYIKTLKRKKHIIFQGSPGTGKTYLAKHISTHLTSSGDGFCELIQFHPSYSYEDFIQGIRPQTSPDGNLEYSMIPGRFLTFCKKAEKHEGMCILIIDEINRANLSQVFGELMYLLEYREEEIHLVGSDQPFKIPENVYIIGTMNTADRSIALVDHALRRRFAFIPIKPNYDILKKYHQKHNPNYDIESLINILKELNKTINDPHYEIGVSFFLTETLPEDLEDIWTMEIEPYLEEYFFDETDKIDKFRWTNI